MQQRLVELSATHAQSGRQMLSKAAPLRLSHGWKRAATVRSLRLGTDSCSKGGPSATEALLHS